MHTWTLRRGGVLITVDEYGDASAPAAVVLHGAGSTADLAARAFGPALAARGYRVVAPDLRGHARSTPLADPADHAVEEHLADLAALVERVQAQACCGISLGAHLALAHAAAFPVDLLLIALPGWFGPVTEVAAANAAWAEQLDRIGVPAVLARIAGDPAVPGWVARELSAAWPRHDPASLVAALRAVAQSPAPAPEELRRVVAPVGVVGAVDDLAHPLAAAAAYVAALPAAALRTLSLAEMGDDPARIGVLAMEAAQEAGLSEPR